MNIKEMIELEQMAGMKILAGEKGINRKVVTVSVMDAPDIYNWIKGGEFLITTAFVMRNNPLELKDLIIKLEKRGAAGFGIKIGRFIDKLPDEVLETADKLNFPIVFIPNRFSFVDVINPVLSKLVNVQADRLEISEKIHNSFTDIVLEGGDTEKILDTLKSIIHKDTIFIDEFFCKRFFSKIKPEIKEEIENKRTDYFKNNFLYLPLKVDKKTFGYLIVLDETISGNDINNKMKYEKIALEHALTILKLDLQKRISKHEVEEKYRDKFIHDLIFSNIKSKREVLHQSELYNWEFESKYCVIDVDIDNFKKQIVRKDFKKINSCLKKLREDMYRYIIYNFKKIFNKPIYTTFSDNIIFLISNSEINKNLESKLISLQKKVKDKYDYTVTIGIGNSVKNLSEVDVSYQEAKKTVSLIRKINGDNSIEKYNNLISFRLLDSITDASFVKEFLSIFIKKINKYDNEHDGELLLTLEVLIKNNWNLSKTSEKLFIHYNTIKYRLKKIEELLSLDLSKHQNRLNISLALHLIQLKKNK